MNQQIWITKVFSKLLFFPIFDKFVNAIANEVSKNKKWG